MNRLKSCDELLVEMVAFDTVNAAISGRTAPELPLAEHLASHAEQLGFAARRLPVEGSSFNLLISFEPTRGAPWLLFVSHMDTVSAANMTVDPFRASVRDGRLCGRGACDTKASGAAMLSALAAYRDAGLRFNNIAILFTIDEEIGKSGIRAFVERQLPTLGFRPAGAIVGEPTGLRPVVAHNGVVRWTICTRGISAHSSDPKQGRSAISMMVRVIQAIESRYIPGLAASHPLTGKAQCSINLVRGGSQINIIPDHCRIEIDRRIVPGENPHAVLPAVESVLDELRREDSELCVQQETPFVDPPLDPGGDDGLIKFVQAVLVTLGLPGQAMGSAFGTEASSFKSAAIPALVLGPGSIEQAHTVDEWVCLDQVHRAVEIYFGLMSRPLESW